jgi:hypothetical protein
MVLDAIIGKEDELVILVHVELDGICGCGGMFGANLAS